MDFPHNLIEQYLKASSKLKKFFDRVSVFKRFAPNVQEVQHDFARLAIKFEEAGIHPYAAMCHLGVSKCEFAMRNNVNEVQAYLRSARCFLKAHQNIESLHLRTNMGAFKEGALRSYYHALERTADDSVLKAAIIREMSTLQAHTTETSSFASPAHRIHELEVMANKSLEQRDFLNSLQYLDDIVDNINERKQQQLYMDLIQRTEILRLLLLMVLNLPASRQSPSHIKLIEYYYNLSNLEELIPNDGLFKPALQCLLAEIVLAWCEHRCNDLKLLLQQFSNEFSALNSSQRFVLNCICDQIESKY